MRKALLKNAKLVVTVESAGKNDWIRTVRVYDNRIQSYRSEEYIHERGIERFLNLSDMKETLNWNLNGDASKYRFQWIRTSNGVSEGEAYIFH